MKFRLLFPLFILVVLLSACNFTLAEDITPPPNYIPPTPMPTLVLYPAQKPNLVTGAAIYAEKCAPCHGSTGLGDGPQGIQLSVTVRAFGLPEIARPASPAQYYTMVTRGNIERFMPPFSSLTDQERWDVTGYVMTLHTTPDEIERGKQLFEENCAGCSTTYFEDQQVMSGLTAVELARIAKQGNDQIKAFGANFTDEELWAVASYLRSLSFDTSTPPDVASANLTPVSAAAAATPIETSQVPTEGEATAVLEPGFGTVSGSIANETGAKFPSDLTVTLRGFDHDTADPNAGPVEVLTLDARVRADGSYEFDQVEIPTNRIFVAEIEQGDITLQSEFAIVEEGAQSVSIPSITLYDVTEDTSALVMDQVHLIFEYGTDSIQVYGIYSFRNTGNEIIVVPQSETGDIPFIQFPEGATSPGFEPTQNSERFMSTDTGFALAPSENAYQLIAFSSLARMEKLDFSQSFALPVGSITVFTPVGVNLDSPQLTDLGEQTIQNFNYHVYQAAPADSGSKLGFVISGNPDDATTATGTNRGWLIGAAVLGIVLIAAGIWMYRRDQSTQGDEEEEPENEFDSADEVMDAIIALDDLHTRKKISDKAYQKKRAELKEILKGMM